MPTGDRKVNIYEKRLLSLTAIGDDFLDFLVNEIDSVASAIFQGISGVLDDDEIEITSSSNDTFSLDTTDASRCLVGSGKIIDLTGLPASLYTSVPFENSTGVTYSVGIKFAEVEDGIEINPRTGDPEYPRLKQSYGELDNPDSVTDFTTYIRLVVNSVTGSSEDHSGREIRVWLVDPVSPVESIAFYDGTIAYSSPNNYVDIPYTSPNGPLGQDTGVSPPSTVAADYLVFVEGPTWRNKANKDLSTDYDYAFIGEITGNGPGATPIAFDISNQRAIFLNTLDIAYDGASGSGSGRVIWVDAGAVELRSRTGTTDEHQASMRVDRKDDSENGGIAVQVITDRSDGQGACSIQCIPLVHSTEDLIVDNPATSSNPDIVTRTGLVNWVNSNVRTGADFAWLQGFSTIDGLYAIAAVAATTLQLRNLDGSAPTFPGAETGNVTILRVVQAVSAPGYGSATLPTVSAQGPNVFTGLNEDSVPPVEAAAKFYGYDNAAIFVYDTLTSPSSPAVKSTFTRRGLLSSYGVEVTANPYPFSGAEDEQVFAVKAPLNDPPDTTHTARIGGIWNSRGKEVARWEVRGRLAEVQRFKDDFQYNASVWGTGSTVVAAPYYTFSGNGLNPTLSIITSGSVEYGGWAELQTRTAAASAGDYAQLRGEEVFQLLRAGPTNIAALCLFAEIFVPATTYNPQVRIGFGDLSANNVIWWEVNLSTAQPWTLKATDGTTTSSEATTIQLIAARRTKLFIIADPFASSPNGYIGGWIDQGGTEDLLTGFAFPSFAGYFTGPLGLKLWVQTNGGGPSAVDINYWEAWQDNNLRSGPAR